MNTMRLGLLAAMAAGLAGMLGGCAMFRTSNEDVSVDQMGHMDADYDATDMRKSAEKIVDALLASTYMKDQAEAPIVIIADVQNRTSQYLDTKNLSDRMRTLLLQSGKARFINESRRQDVLREQGYQAANVTPGQQVSIGKQLGAKYMLSGSLTEMANQSGRQVRISKTRLNYYKLTIEMTSIETGEIIWTDEAEFARKASEPLIGW